MPVPAPLTTPKVYYAFHTGTSTHRCEPRTWYATFLHDVPITQFSYGCVGPPGLVFFPMRQGRQKHHSPYAHAESPHQVLMSRLSVKRLAMVPATTTMLHLHSQKPLAGNHKWEKGCCVLKSRCRASHRHLAGSHSEYSLLRSESFTSPDLYCFCKPTGELSLLSGI